MRYTIALGFGAFLLFSCAEKPCANTNPVFDKSTPQNSEYKAELAKELSKGAEVYFSVEEYKVGAEVDTLYVGISGDSFCATGIAQVSKKNEKLAGIRGNEGKGYHGASLLGVQFRLVGNELILDDVTAVID